jgi:hypothetical protein
VPLASLFVLDFGLEDQAPIFTADERILIPCLLCVQTLPGPVTDPKRLLKWNYDGSSTGEVQGEYIEEIL